LPAACFWTCVLEQKVHLLYFPVKFSLFCTFSNDLMLVLVNGYKPSYNKLKLL
jgi:hypothetical protein